MSVVVLIPAKAKRLTTLASVRIDTGTILGSATDLQVDRFINQASERAARYCRRSFGRQTYRERLDRRPSLGAQWKTPSIVLSAGPVVKINRVVFDGVLLDPSAYELDGIELHLLSANRRVEWFGSCVVVEYEAGWLLPCEDRGIPPTTAADLPMDVESAVIQLVSVAMSGSGRDPRLRNENVEGVGSSSWYLLTNSAVLAHPEAETALSNYRQMVFV